MRIVALEIKSGDVAKQLKFYRDVLGLEITNYSEEAFDAVVGYTLIRFIYSEKATPYHIAIHIPDSQEEKALEWVQERVPVLRNNNEEIIDFSNWNARSVYFYDADRNIVEFISRRNLHRPSSAIFTEKSLLGVAEVGLATADIAQKFKFLQEYCELEVFDGNFEKFCAIGDKEGLLITIDKNLKDWFPTGDKAYISDFKIRFSHKEKDYGINFENDQLSHY